MKKRTGGIISGEKNANRRKLLTLERFIKKSKPSVNKRGVLMTTLHKVQEIFGYIPEDIMDRVSHKLQIPAAHIYGMVTFYNHFSLKPKARFQICVCKGTACYVSGGARILSAVKEELGIEVGDTTKDGLFGLAITRCLGCCGLSPVMRVNDDIYIRMVPERVPTVLKKYRVKAR